ncbi:MAG: transposase [Gammaproteobacteria bacterium]|nr:transposase [Gammaproteobacteria bacterium]
MPRKPRMYLPGVPCHVIQRGNNRDACFFAEEDYLFYRECLGSAARRYRVAVHAYVLMTNHVHILMSPEDEAGVSRVVQSVGRRYVQYVNRTYRRSGTLWEGRHKSSLVQAESYLMACQRYIELNPVRAGMVEHPGDYRWSSYNHNAWGHPDPIISPHSLYLRLSRYRSDRLGAYRDLFDIELPPGDIHCIRKAASFSMPLGNNRFRDQIESVLNRRIGQAYRGRPRRGRE